MSAEALTGGPGEAISFAEQLQAKHADGHNPTVEEVVDEEDIVHPPPSSVVDSSGPVLDTPNEPLSENAMGKKKVQEEGSSEDPTLRQKIPALDTKSEELFPALGSGPKTRVSGQIPVAWSSKKPASIVNGTPRSVNGTGTGLGAANTRASTSAAGPLPMSSANIPIQPRGQAPQVSMPGKYRESVHFAPTQLLPRNQLKKPLLDVVREINKRSKATVEMRPGREGNLEFVGVGPTVESVRQALKDVAKQLGSKQAVKIPVPASTRPHIIGRQGTTVNGIMKRSGAHIQIPKSDDGPKRYNDDDDDATIDILVEGDAIAAEIARREIEAIVNERTSTVNIRLRDVPAELYPFLAGPYNVGSDALSQGRDVEIKIPHYYSWTHQPPPQVASPNDLPSFIPHPDRHIQLSGDRNAVQDVKAQIERQVEALRKSITLSELAINRGQHQFILGNDGESLHDLLKDTGCSVILPPESNDTEMLTIVGPRDRLETGMDSVMNLATSMQMASVDVARQHSSAPLGAQAHARALTDYLRQRQAIAKLEKLYDSRIVLPAGNDGPMTWEVYSRDGKNTIRARSDIMNLINAHPPTRLKHLEMDPFFYQHLREHHQARVQQDYGVHVVVPPENEQSRHLILVYEGPNSGEDFELPRQRPSPTEVSNFEQALMAAYNDLRQIASSQKPIDTRDIEVPSRFHDKVRKFARREQEDLPISNIPIQLIVNPQMGNNEQRVSFKDSGSRPHTVSLRGPSDRLEEFANKLYLFVESEEKDELERNFTTSFDFPQKYANFLIGKRGENINKLREEFDVEIQVNEGKVDLKGPEAKALAAKSRILAMSKKLEDEATHVIKIKPQYHREMIGAKGSNVNKLQDRLNVRIQFPRSAQNGHDDESVVDGSEGGGHRHTRANQAPDEVVIRGPRKGADQAREELLDLLNYTIERSHMATVSVARGQLPSLIGQGGREMDNIRELTGAQVDVPDARESTDASGRVVLKIKGGKKEVDAAKKLLEERAKVFDDSITRVVNVDKKYHKALIGSGGSNLRTIVVQAGGSAEPRDLARTVRFPRPEVEESGIRVEGNKAIVEKIVAAIETFVADRENQATEVVEVPPEKHRLLIGRGGETRRALESQLGVSIDIPKQTVQGAARSQVKLVGPPEKIQPARDHILDMVKDNEGETVQVPLALHHLISDNGQFFRRLRNDHRVTVEHAGQQPPPKSFDKVATRANGGANLPLITDEQGSEDNYSWSVVDNSTDNGVEGDIPWVLRGSSENVAKAKVALQKALQQAKTQSSAGYLILPDPSTYRLVIGSGGSQINAIRKQTGCKITVPRDQAKGEAIELVGSKEGVEEAKDIILSVVKNGGSSRRQS